MFIHEYVCNNEIILLNVAFRNMNIFNLFLFLREYVLKNTHWMGAVKWKGNPIIRVKFMSLKKYLLKFDFVVVVVVKKKKKSAKALTFFFILTLAEKISTQICKKKFIIS